ncbi:MAG: SDR family NAD(P)-dependent oxidoreductase, partial [Bacteroidia bacterium]|nr:SDR family NAD(P)-dependent oxidoreductase [Bacteroidia bacterium]
MLILVTGASKGIGFELVKKLSGDPGNLVVAVSRNIKTLRELVDKNNTTSLLPFKADITKAGDLQKILKLIQSLKLPLDIIVNNAGLIVNKPFL